MSDNKKYYYLKLKENFFDSDEMIVLEAMQDGYMYSNILLKLYLRSLKNEGRLMFNDRIPFSSGMLASVTRQSVGVVEKAMKIFKELGLVDILDNGAIYMTDIQNFIGRSSSEADRIREYRNKIEQEKGEPVQMLQQKNNKRTPEIELEKELDLDLELELDLEIETDKAQAPSERINYQEITEAFNLLPLSNIKIVNERRKKAIRTVIKEYGIHSIKEVFENVNNSPFLKGHVKDWQADFDWIFKPQNYLKILEGNYSQKKNEDTTDNIFLKMLREEERKDGQKTNHTAINYN